MDARTLALVPLTLLWQWRSFPSPTFRVPSTFPREGFICTLSAQHLGGRTVKKRNWHTSELQIRIVPLTLHTVTIYNYMIYVIHDVWFFCTFIFSCIYSWDLLLGSFINFIDCGMMWDVEIKSSNRAVNPAQPNQNRMGPSKSHGLKNHRPGPKLREVPWLPTFWPSCFSVGAKRNARGVFHLSRIHRIHKANATKVQHPHPSTPWRLPMSSQPPLCSHMECAPLRRKLFNQDCHVGFYTGFYRAVPFRPHCCIYNLSSKRQLCDCTIIDVTCCYMFEMRGPDWMKGTRPRDKRQS